MAISEQLNSPVIKHNTLKFSMSRLIYNVLQRQVDSCLFD